MHMITCEECQLSCHIPLYTYHSFQMISIIATINEVDKIGNLYQIQISFIAKYCSSTLSLFAHHTTAWCCRLIPVAAVSWLGTNSTSRWTCIIVDVYLTQAGSSFIFWAFRRSFGRSDARIGWPKVAWQWLRGFLIYTRIIVISQETPFLAVVLAEKVQISIE